MAYRIINTHEVSPKYSAPHETVDWKFGLFDNSDAQHCAVTIRSGFSELAMTLSVEQVRSLAACLNELADASETVEVEA